MRMLSDQDLREKKGIKFSRQHRLRLIKARRFPAPVKLGFGTNGRNAWREDEIDDYLNGRIEERDAPVSSDTS